MTPNEPVLKTSTGIQVLQRLFNNEAVESIVDKLETEEVIELQHFMWEKTVEFGIKAKGKKFSRTEITEKMIPSSKYQEMKNCKEPSYICKGTQCIYSNPICAMEKIKSHIAVMSSAIREYVGLDLEEKISSSK